MQTFKTLVTGGAGYIGSHTVVQLLEAGHEVVILDNFSNCCSRVVDRLEQITGQSIVVEEGDIRDALTLAQIFQKHQIEAVVHFAGLKAVGESVAKPELYYSNNVVGTLELLKAMSEHGCYKLVFSSSATVYGDPASVPIMENFPLFATNPYGQSKLMVEHILRDFQIANSEWQISILRYFNPVAAHSSGLIGEDPSGIPNNLLPYIAQVAVGRREALVVHGDDYTTPDGTGVRDYIHVVDLADAHLAALNALTPEHGCREYNIGTGRGHSVLEMVRAFEQASGQQIAYQIGPRRPGDIAECFANADRAKNELGWVAKADVAQMMLDHWRWQSNNPNGY